ncbi:hypothetical protein IJI31_07210, partial [bacterium]|nr:hypothetical protein [bacterium]
MAVKTKDLVIDINELTEDKPIEKPKESAIYFKGKTYAEAVTGVAVNGDNLEITTTNSGHKIILKDYYKQNGKNP